MIKLDRRAVCFANALLLFSAAAAPSARNAEAKKKIVLLATGGTIAGSGSAAAPAYRPGVIPIAEILKAVPGLQAVANVTAEQVANVGSADVDEAIWRKLVSRINAALADPSVYGVVITHGTDTLEETAYFLSLLVPRSKPVVLVGAMRPATMLSADGPQNLLDAVRVASSDDARGRGPLVVMNDSIFDPVSVTKVAIRRVDGFAAPLGGPVGDVLAHLPRFYRAAVPSSPAFELQPAPLPRVSIAYTYAGFDARDLQRTVEGVDGLVIAGAGSGGVPTSVRAPLQALITKGLPVVRTARHGGGDVWTAREAGVPAPAGRSIIAGRELSPAKARILLMLALQRPRTPEELQLLFTQYGLAGR
jgi:L-asparaginase